MEKLVSEVKVYGKRFHIYRMPSHSTVHLDHDVDKYIYNNVNGSLYALMKSGIVCTTDKSLLARMDHSPYRSLPGYVVDALCFLGLVTLEEVKRLAQEENDIKDLNEKLSSLEELEGELRRHELSLSDSSSKLLMETRQKLNDKLRKLVCTIEGCVSECTDACSS